MKRVIITNNKKVIEEFAEKAEVRYEDMTAPEILEKAKEIIGSGGKMLVDPARTPLKNYYRSIPFIMDGSEPSQESIKLIDKCLGKMESKKDKYSKEPVLSGVQQNSDMDMVRKVLG